MYQAMKSSRPVELQPGDWHLPYVSITDATHCTADDLPKISTARCARVSYLTHDGIRDLSQDIKLHDKLLTSGHMSPFEHVACVEKFTWADFNDDNAEHAGNLRRPWAQYRKMIPHEAEALTTLDLEGIQ